MLSPRGSRLLVKVKEGDTKTASGLIIPETYVREQQDGEVLAVGPGKTSGTTGEREGAPASVGQIVVFYRGAGTKFTVDGMDTRLIDFSDVLGRLGE